MQCSNPAMITCFQSVDNLQAENLFTEMYFYKFIAMAVHSLIKSFELGPFAFSYSSENLK